MLALVRLYRGATPSFNGNRFHYLVEGIPHQGDNFTNSADSIAALASNVEAKIRGLRELEDVDDLRVTFDPPADYTFAPERGFGRRCYALGASERDEFDRLFFRPGLAD